LIKAQQLFQECGDRNGLMHVLFYQSVIAFQEKSIEQFQSSFQQFAQLCMTNGYHYFLQKKMILGPSNQMIFYELLQYNQQCGSEEHAAIVGLRQFLQPEESM
ncbi:MAG TPA: hypothetical protein DDY89_23185, partial [Lysinibacillus sp.]|nr:hypothetical protein [Lysinibacillus sp.]